MRNGFTAKQVLLLRPADKPLSEAMMVISLTDIYVTRPQSGNKSTIFIYDIQKKYCRAHICDSHG